MNYTEQNWEDEMRVNKFCGRHHSWFSSGCMLSCPQCQSIGFYGPKLTADEAGKITRKYRACKFCGFWQEAWGNVFDERGGGPYRCIAVFCDKCQNNYDWRAPWAYEPGGCQNCHIELKKTNWASDDPNHFFHKLKAEMDKLHQASDITSNSQS